MATTNRDRLSDSYDLRAYEEIVRSLTRPPGRIRALASKASGAIGAAGKRVTDRVPEAARHSLERAVTKTMDGFRVLIVEPSFRSVMVSRVQKRYQRLGHPISSLDDITHLSLQTIDKATPPLGTAYALTMAAEGAVAGAVVTGAELLGSMGTAASAGVAAGPSAGAVAAAIAADAAAVLGSSMRVIAHIGAYFGRDMRLPEEQAFALSVVNWSNAGSEGAKQVAFQQLSRLTQQLIRGATWRQLNEHALVVAIERAMTAMGFNLTKRKLGQAVPVLGIAIGAGLNAEILHSVARDARAAYRLRHLVETYALDPSEFGAASDPSADDNVVDILGEISQSDDGNVG